MKIETVLWSWQSLNWWSCGRWMHTVHKSPPLKIS